MDVDVQEDWVKYVGANRDAFKGCALYFHKDDMTTYVYAIVHIFQRPRLNVLMVEMEQLAENSFTIADFATNPQLL